MKAAYGCPNMTGIANVLFSSLPSPRATISTGVPCTDMVITAPDRDMAASIYAYQEAGTRISDGPLTEITALAGRDNYDETVPPPVDFHPPHFHPGWDDPRASEHLAIKCGTARPLGSFRIAI
jgi:hypothetical protein